MSNIVKKGAVDVSRYVMLVDSADGAPETAYAITSLDLQYTRQRSTPATKVDATALSATNSAHADNRAIEIDAASSPGLYRVDWPDAAFATGADKVLLVVSATGLHPAVEEIQLVDYDPEDGIRLGLTALPNAVADAAGGLSISDAGGLDLDAKLANTNEVTAARMGALTDWIDGGRLDLLLGAIPTTAMRGTNNAALEANVQSHAAAALTAYDPPTNTEMTSAFTEIKGATWSSATDTLEALRDRGDAAWITAAGFSTLDQAGVRAAVGLAAANLDTQLADVPTVAEFNARTLLASAYFDPAVDVVANVTLVGTLTTYTGNTPQTGDSYARLGAPAGASMAADVAAAKADTAAILIDTGTDGVVLTAAERNAVADGVLSRNVSNVEATAGDHSLCYVVLAMGESNTTANAGKLTVFRTDGTTEFAQKTIATDAAADPITGVQ